MSEKCPKCGSTWTTECPWGGPKDNEGFRRELSCVLPINHMGPHCHNPEDRGKKGVTVYFCGVASKSEFSITDIV